MRCDRCDRDAILLQRYSGLRLCGEHLISGLESRAKGTIRAHGWIRPGDRIAVALSGGPASVSLLHFLVTHFGMRRDLSFIAITVDEGGWTDLGRTRAIAEGMGIEWAAASPHREIRGDRVPGQTEAPFGGTGLRDDALASLARDGGATKLALGTSLDSMARSVFLKVLDGDGAGLTRGSGEGEGGIPRIEPFIRIPAGELALYAMLNSLDHVSGRGMDARDSLEAEAGRLLDDFAARHPSAPFSLANLGEVISRGTGGGRTHG